MNRKCLTDIPSDIYIIAHCAFQGCINIKNHENLEMEQDDMYESATFKYCDYLTEIYIKATECSGTLYGGSNATVYCYSETQKEGNYWYYNEQGEVTKWN